EADAFPAFRKTMGKVAEALRSGRGFALVNRVPMDKYTAEEARVIYWVAGQILGDPFDQDVKGTLLFEVRDTGQDVKQGARFSVTNAESSFHTDGAFNSRVPDMVGLLCLQTAKSGGESQLISAFTLHNELQENHPDVFEALYQSFSFDRRGQFKEGEESVTRTPIFRWDGEALWLRYLYYYIQVGHELTNDPLSPAQQQALEAVEALLRREDLRVQFSLERGQMLFTNNRWILHNRTAFQDHEDLDKRRHYVRLWLSQR
ncbi:MAG: TauD/TfdA family dioxygenase, partial [bacterium]|nr:TauD/TfdA family dioxygenase [bacterium]